MDHSEKVRRAIHPREKANVFSLITFVYMGGLLTKGFKKNLDDDDLYEVVTRCRSKKNADKLEHTYFSKAKTKDADKKVSLVRILWNLYGLRYLGLGIFHMTGRLLVSTLEPDALSNLIRYFKPGQTQMTIYDACYFASIMIGLKFFHTVYFQNYQIYLAELALQMRVSFSSVIYRKALRLSPKALEDTSLGNIVTVITKDVNLFEQAIFLFNDVWISSLQIIVVCYLIYHRIGMSCFVGVMILFLLVPFQVYISGFIKTLRLKMSKRTDERLQRMQEALSTIKTIKMYTWENVFAGTIAESRIKEMGTLIQSQYCKMAMRISGDILGKFAFYAILMVYIWLYNDMSPEDVFYVMKIFSTLRMTVALHFSMGFAKAAETLAALQRINHILQLEELPDHIDKPDDEPQVDLRNVSLRLKDMDILKDINLKLEMGLNVVTGQLGCGKSALIKVILRDYPVEGDVRTRGRKSYASQDPWLFPSSIKQNILFGEKYDYKRYNMVVHACALEYDFSILNKGDETIVADRGMNLSKGQQARINLARCIYKDSDIYLIDDALTALDPRVQEHIFTHCIQGFLKDKCVVLVTHNTKHIKMADNLVILKNGAVSFAEKQSNITDELLEAIEVVEPVKEDEEEQIEEEKSDEKQKMLKGEPVTHRKQVYHETKRSGSISLRFYADYIKLGGGVFMGLLLIAFYAAATFSATVSEKELSNWINQKSLITKLKEDHIKNTTIDLEQFYVENATTVFLNATFNVSAEVLHKIGKLEMRAAKTMNIYTILIIGSAVLELVQGYLILRFGLRASINLHKKMVNKVLNALMTFFDTFFIGNILNRFAQDLNVVDEHLNTVMAIGIAMLFHLAGAVSLIASVNWRFIIPAIALALFSAIFRAIYIRTSRSLKRLEAATRSPIVGHLNSTMEGLTTIRAYRAQEILKDEFDKYQDVYTSAYFTSQCVKGAFGFIMEVSSLFFLMSIIGRFLFFDTGTFAGDVGLTLSQVGMLSMIIQMGLMVWSDLENNMTSVERAMEYTDIENENKTGIEVEDWPSRGEIVYEGVSLKYANSEDKILKDISFKVMARERIGIVGRTGAGKSSIISSLFRLYNFSGKISIDGVEIKTLALDFLRQHMSIIPQDPIMFSGTIRSNIDPLEEFTDEEIWRTLHKVKLDILVGSLETHVEDTNFSTGQRQLICLARAIVRKNKIVILDEATANMDPETELIAQRIIDENFTSCTLFIIAHRLDTILDCDKVLVLDRGTVAEFDQPLTLLKNPRGLFTEMLRNAGLHDKISSAQ